MKKKLSVLVLLLVMMVGLTACPSGTSEYNTVSEYKAETEGAASNGDTVSVDKDSMFAETKDGQKLIYTGSVTIETDSIKKTYKKVTENMKEYGAFFESVNDSATYKSIDIRIPKKDYMKFYESLSEVDGTITSSSVNIQDSTKTYTDNEKRIEILQTEYDELKDLMTKANTVEEILSIRDRMSTVTYEIESLKGANNVIDYDAEYGSLNLTLSLNGSHEEASFWHQFKEAFSGGIYLFKKLILALTYLWWVILLAAYMIIASKKKWWPFKNMPERKPNPERRKRQPKKQEKHEESAN